MITKNAKRQENGSLNILSRFPKSRVSPPERFAKLVEANEILEFGHSLESQIGGQLKAGMVITELYEDNWSDEATPLNKYGPLYIATLARKSPFSAG